MFLFFDVPSSLFLDKEEDVDDSTGVRSVDYHGGDDVGIVCFEPGRKRAWRNLEVGDRDTSDLDFETEMGFPGPAKKTRKSTGGKSEGAAAGKPQVKEGTAKNGEGKCGKDELQPEVEGKLIPKLPTPNISSCQC